MTTPEPAQKETALLLAQAGFSYWGAIIGGVSGALLANRSVKKATTGRTVGYTAGFAFLGGGLFGVLSGMFLNATLPTK